nr:hypothetical protein CFP56_04146 [Quercus suber]
MDGRSRQSSGGRRCFELTLTNGMWNDERHRDGPRHATPTCPDSSERLPRHSPDMNWPSRLRESVRVWNDNVDMIPRGFD